MLKFSIHDQSARRILILDGGLGTMIQGYGLSEEDYRGTRFADWKILLKGCNDLLVLTRPQVIAEIHEAYLKAGADIISTDTFNASAVSMADYGLEAYVYEMNRAAAALARKVADGYTLRNPSKPRFVAGSIGPTNRTASISPDVNNPGYRAVTFDDLRASYAEQVRGLLDGGADVLLIETIFDTLNAKAALFAIEETFAERGRRIPVMVSGTITDASGRTLSGQTIEAFYASIAHANPFSVGLNCGYGAELMLPYIERLAAVAGCAVSSHPNAGLPNGFGGYDETPEMMAATIGTYLDKGLLNIVGGCCGTTPEHIAAIAQVASKYTPRAIPEPEHVTTLSGLETLRITPEANFVNVGERTNVAGSAKFAGLIREKKYEEALSVARQQVEGGAQIVDICMDDGLIDGPTAMRDFLNLVMSEPDIARVPVMIDSSKWEVLETGLKCVQGKSVVNSISLKEGEREFLHRAGLIRRYGAGGRRNAVRRTGSGRYFRTENRGRRPRLQIADRKRLPGRRHHLRSQRAVGSHRYRRTRRLRHRLHPRLRLDQGQLSVCEGQRRGQQPVVLVPRQQQGARGDAFGIPVPCDRRRDGHGHRQPVDAAGVQRNSFRIAGTMRKRRAEPASRRDRTADRIRTATQG